MAVLQDILVWSKKLQLWQRDALRRILTTPILVESDYNELFLLLKYEHGIHNPSEPKARPLSEHDIPALQTDGTRVVLRAIKNIRNVNAIAENASMTVGETGLTVIYGDNGAGKSGYSRVLKHACRARDQSETVLQHAYREDSGVPEATFEIVVDGLEKEVVWTRGQPAPPELSAFIVFDTHCARSYLDKEGDFSFMPAGLDTFETLADVSKRLLELVRNESEKIPKDKSAFQNLVGPTEVGKMISSISENTNLPEVSALAHLTSDELQALDELEKSLKTQNPIEAARQLRQRAQRFQKIGNTIQSKQKNVSPDAANILLSLASANRTARETADLAKSELGATTSLLPGTGNKAWRELFAAARAFSVEAYPNKDLGELDPADKCPLCQKELAEDAKRLQRFSAFVTSSTEDAARAAASEYRGQMKRFEDLEMNLMIDVPTFDELYAHSPELAQNVKDFQAALFKRHSNIRAALNTESLESHTWSDDLSRMVSPIDRLDASTRSFTQQADAYEQASDEISRKELENRHAELEARRNLSLVVDQVTALVNRFIHHKQLSSCLKALSTSAISRKSKELSERYISQHLQDALEDEFRELQVTRLKVAPKSRSQEGRPRHKLALDVDRAHSLSSILSEGEQRAIAIGAFLVEARLSEGHVGLIFDDPVSSLDHGRRELVASRLIKAAQDQQVVVFTHDLYFLNLLTAKADEEVIPVTARSLTVQNVGHGVVEERLPFGGMNVGRRIRALNAKHQSIDKLFRDNDLDEQRQETVQAYRALRDAWERALEEVLFKNVVVRFRKSIETQRLKDVSILDSDYELVSAAVKRCSDHCHDNAAAQGHFVPDPATLLCDIEELDSWIKELNSRSIKLGQSRKQSKPTSF